jgi:hypothetical protein
VKRTRTGALVANPLQQPKRGRFARQAMLPTRSRVEISSSSSRPIATSRSSPTLRSASYAVDSCPSRHRSRSDPKRTVCSSAR